MLPDLIRFITKTLLILFYRFRVEGLENVPVQGGLIVVSNHCANADPPVLDVAVWKARKVRYLAKKELFSVPFLGAFLTSAGEVPLDRGKAGGDLRALRVALEVLEKGGCLGVFPEGTRSREGKPGRPKLGVSLLASKTGAQVLPAYITGTDKLPFVRQITVRLGKPFSFQESGLDYEGFAEKTMSEILTLKGKHDGAC